MFKLKANALKAAMSIAFFASAMVPTQVFSLGEVTYTGTITSTPTATNSGHGTGFSVLGSATASAAITLKYTILKVVALSIFDESASPTTNPLLSAETPVASVFNLTADANDIGVGSDVTRTNFDIHGVVFSNTGSGAGAMTVGITANNGSTGSTLNLRNGTDEVQVGLSGTVGGQAFASLGTSVTPTLNAGGRGLIDLAGDVDESTLDVADPPGDYTAIVTIALTAP
ncbi:MAG: hypothetical protein QNJ31_04205 [Candidatus Caenarcaniphilales bacterium]|nr:hypothetical protein [Candidatus Caenarcaniphilales bacterium]